MEQGKVEVDEIELEFCLFHVFIVFLPCGFSDVEHTNFKNKIIKLWRWSNWEQNMWWHTQICSLNMGKTWLNLLYFYNDYNVYEGWYGRW